MENLLEEWLGGILRNEGLTGNSLVYIKTIILFCLVLIVAALLFLIVEKIIVRGVHAFLLRTKTKWDDVLVEHKVFVRLAHLVPALVFKAFMPLVFAEFEWLGALVAKLTDIYIFLVLVSAFISFLRALEAHFSTLDVFKNKPLASYFQLGRILIYIATGILVLSILMGKSPLVFLSAFGALSAIILLIFKDTILGLVASVQISSNDMVRVGDWIEMPKFNADGDVIAINLNTVKIRNWDKTVTTVPTYYFITDSFKNWRGMRETGGRRIKRSIYINLRSIKFVDPEMRERFKRFHLVTDYITTRQKEIEEYNTKYNIDTSTLINGRRMTNIGVFRRYAQTFLEAHPGVNQNLFVLVRQLQPDANGLPLEIYCFTKSVAWADYEGVQADIFDHLLAASSHFDLEVFQNPSGNDITLLGESLGRHAEK